VNVLEPNIVPIIDQPGVNKGLLHTHPDHDEAAELLAALKITSKNTYPAIERY
jgi:hypothetical protein